MTHDVSAGLGPVLLAVLVEEASAVRETPQQCLLRREASLAAARNAALAAEYSARLIAQNLRCVARSALPMLSTAGSAMGANRDQFVRRARRRFHRECPADNSVGLLGRTQRLRLGLRLERLCIRRAESGMKLFEAEQPSRRLMPNCFNVLKRMKARAITCSRMCRRSRRALEASFSARKPDRAAAFPAAFGVPSSPARMRRPSEAKSARSMHAQ
jgi:hypothetical protein